MNSSLMMNSMYWFLLMFSMVLFIFNNFTTMMTMINLMIFTLIASLLLTKIKILSLYSMLMFLMIIGGLMILFMMFLSLISNEFSNFKPLKLNFFNISIYYLIFLMVNSMSMHNFIQQTIYIHKPLNFLMNLSYIIMNPNNFIYIYLILILIIFLILITKLCLLNNKPLRKFFN